VTGRDKTLLNGETSRLLVTSWLALHRIGELSVEVTSSDLISRYGLARPLQEELSGEAAIPGDLLAELDLHSVMSLFRLLLRWESLFSLPSKERGVLFRDLLQDRDVAIFIGLHASGGYKWFVKERWLMMLQWLKFTARLCAAGNRIDFDDKEADKYAEFLASAAESAGYRLDRLKKGFGC
jgi:hypothetical protein